MYKQCTTEEAASRQRQIEACLLENLRHKPFEQISVADLCKQLGISRGIFYRYFDDKYGCLIALIDHTLTDFVEYEPEIDASLEKYPVEILRFLMFWREQAPLLEALRANHIGSVLTERAVTHIFREEPDTLHWYGAEQDDFGVDTMLFAMSGAVAILMRWHASGYNRSLAQMAELCVRVTTKPLAYQPPDQ